MLTMNDIIREGHPTLRKKAEPISLPPSTGDKETLKKMLDFLVHSQDPEMAEKHGLRPGVGLAAPQINISKQMMAIRSTDHNDEIVEYALFNPKIISHSAETTYLESGEGCLSVDREVNGIVPRYARIKIEGYNLEGKKITERLRGFLAIVFQHELDHLNGIMFYDRIEQDDPFKQPLPPGEIVIRNDTDAPL
ncbi:peptide deformylase [Salipaludibacillus agaradhaerens]|uniref:Peptide deformylase n=1 Tax=Salipaludibacillus agaradhaerens TaxID=76935 RepID=A0A9Q4FVX3_SALAG|nr:peptide deformylase [Salipaludibacillus agaradhaerens]MCR6095880.1 peptide deformylase [Salipaludibacillus agaradhaerens]MCR6114561.1 peptide deformylase [Salipaludibacillus agaradhaerens]